MIIAMLTSEGSLHNGFNHTPKIVVANCYQVWCGRDSGLLLSAVPELLLGGCFSTTN